MNATQSKLTELSKLLDQAKQLESQQTIQAGPYGNDLVDLYNKIRELLASLGIDNLAGEGVHAAIHYAIDWLTTLAVTLPMWQKIVVTALIIPLLTAIDKRWHPEPAPA